MSKKKFALLKKIVSCAVIAGLLLSFPANAKAMEKISASDGTSVTLTDGNYFTFQNETAKAIKKAKPNASLTLHTDKWISFNKQVLSALKERSDVSLTIEYKKDGQIKSFTIPAGFDVMSLANNEGYAGFLYIEKNVLLAKSEAKAESQTPPDTKGVPFAEAMGMTFSNYFPTRWNNPPLIFVNSYDHSRYSNEDIAYVSRSGLLELTALSKLPSERAGYKTYLIHLLFFSVLRPDGLLYRSDFIRRRQL